MHMRHTMCRKKRPGVSTILGTLIFVGIIFSAYVPMTLVMKQADNIYERKIHEAKISDADKGAEDVWVYAYGEAGSTELTVYVSNRGANEITIVRVWRNDDSTEVSETIAPKSSAELGPYDVAGAESPLKVKVTTEKGNIFECNLGSVLFDGVNGWYTPSFAVSVVIMNDWGQYEIIVKDSALPTPNEVGYYKSSGNEQDQITKTFLVSNIPGEYDVEVLKRVGGGWNNLIGPGFKVDVPAGGNPVAIVVVDGT